MIKCFAEKNSMKVLDKKFFVRISKFLVENIVNYYVDKITHSKDVARTKNGHRKIRYLAYSIRITGREQYMYAEDW